MFQVLLFVALIVYCFAKGHLSYLSIKFFSSLVLHLKVLFAVKKIFFDSSFLILTYQMISLDLIILVYGFFILNENGKLILGVAFAITYSIPTSFTILYYFLDIQ